MPNNAIVLVNKEFAAKAIGILGSVIPGSVRSIQAVLEVLLGVHRGVGTISETLKAWGSEALEFSQSIPCRSNEILQEGQPYLTLVDERTFLVVNLKEEA